MRRFCLSFLLILCSISLFAGDQDFTLVNRTGLTIDQLYCSPTTTHNWEEDVLGLDVLQNKQAVKVHFSRDAKACEWDLLIVDEDGDKVAWTGLDLCTAVQITLVYEGNQPTAWIENAEQVEQAEDIYYIEIEEDDDDETVDIEEDEDDDEEYDVEEDDDDDEAYDDDDDEEDDEDADDYDAEDEGDEETEDDGSDDESEDEE